MKKIIIRLIVLGFVLLIGAIGGGMLIPHFSKIKSDSVDINNADLITKGKYIAQLGDCAACHSAPGGKAFAGGLAMQSPFGVIYSANITPDKVTGIGNYSFGEFDRAVRHGIRKDNVALYPAMPFVSYQIVNDDDMKALYAYIMHEVEPVSQATPPTSIPWPINMRWPLAYWNVLFGDSREFIPPQNSDEDIIRGAYIVEGLGHCGTCHTPRGIGFQEKVVRNDANGNYLAGSSLEGWYAKNLRNQHTGLGTWSEDDIISFLKTGRNSHTSAFGSMADAVQNSTQYFSDKDLRSVAKYLKTLAPTKNAVIEGFSQDNTTARLQNGDYSEKGSLAYVANCVACHKIDGQGVPFIFPKLQHSSSIIGEDPSSLIQLVLAGGTGAKTASDIPSFTMPAFANLSDDEVADIVSFIRSGWGNNASSVNAKDVHKIRQMIENKPSSYVPEAGK